jgi:cyclase
MTCRALLIVSFSLLAGVALISTRTQAEPNQVKYIAPGVWFREGDMEQGHCNNIIIEMKDYLLVVDANYPSGARAALADCKRISNKPVKYVFDTHHHGDHLYGNPVWTEMGATTLAYIGVAEELKRYEPQRWLNEAKSRKDVEEMKLPAPEGPKETFEKSPHVLKDGSREVRFYHFGWAHTRGDAMVYLPKEHILCTGDTVVNGPYNNTADANIGNWPTVLRNAEQKLTVESVLPGHGVPGGKELLDGQAQYLSELYKGVQAGISSGKKPEEIAPSLKFSESTKKWAGKDLATQVKHAYEEISEKKPHGDLPH